MTQIRKNIATIAGIIAALFLFFAILETGESYFLASFVFGVLLFISGYFILAAALSLFWHLAWMRYILLAILLLIPCALIVRAISLNYG